MSIFVAVPCATGRVCSGHVGSVLELERICRDRDIDLRVCYENGTSIIHHARNKLVKKFLDSEMETLLFVDDDVQFKAADALRLYDSRYGVVAGLYPYKHYDWTRIREGGDGLKYVFINNDPARLTLDASPEPQEVDGVGTGFMMIRRGVFEQILRDDRAPAYSHMGVEYRAFFEIEMPCVGTGELYGEDYCFCKKWREIGGKVYAVTDAQATHWGVHCYGGEI